MTLKTTPGPWEAVDYLARAECIKGPGGKELAMRQDDATAGDMLSMAAAPELLALAQNFYIKGPDNEGFVWLVLHGHGTSGMGAVNLGKTNSLVVQVALHLERQRRAAIAKATGSAM